MELDQVSRWGMRNQGEQQVNPKTAKEYRAQLTLNNALITITCSDLRQVHDYLRSLQGHVTFDQSDDTSTTHIHADGRDVGWIAQYEVPFAFSVNSLAQSRLKAAA